MAKLEMKLVRIYALRSDRKRLLEKLQRLGTVQIVSDDESAHGFERLDTSKQKLMFERNAASALSAIEILDRYAPEKKGLLDSFHGRRCVTEQNLADFAEKSKDTMKVAEHITELDKQRAENSAERVRIRVNIEQLEPWRDLDVPFCCEGTEKTAAFIGTLPAHYSKEQLCTAVAGINPDIMFDCEIVSASNTMTCMVAVTPVGMKDACAAALRTLGFSRPLGANRSLPADKIKRLEDRLAALEKESDDAAKEIEELASYRRDIEDVSDYYKARAEKYGVIGMLDHSKHTFAIEGYIPAEDCKSLEDSLESVCDCYIEYEDADSATAPVKLKNNAFAAPTESIVEMYSMPGEKDIDPTPIMSFFFYFFFGMMFSDAGYGLIMILATTFVLKKFRPERSMAMSMRMFRNCGVSTFIWGLIYGSFFGDAIAAFAKQFAGADIRIPMITVPLLDPIKDATLIMVLSVAFGLIQILVALGAKFYCTWRDGDKLGALFDTGLWMTALVGLAVLAAGMVFGKTVLYIGAGIAVASAVGLILTQGRSKKGAMKVISGVASLYDITGYVSDLMSYTRLLALGLTTAVMGQVFNVLSLQFAGSPFTWIFMVLVFIIGHAINFGLNALGSYVHTIRLQYVEMFGKFYNGGGEKFTPFALNSKYTRLQEETKS